MNGNEILLGGGGYLIGLRLISRRAELRWSSGLDNRLGQAARGRSATGFSPFSSEPFRPFSLNRLAHLGVDDVHLPSRIASVARRIVQEHDFSSPPPVLEGQPS